MYKQFTPENKNTYEYKALKSFTLTQANLTRYQFLNNSSNEVSKSYYDFARINFYLSGSTSESYLNESFNMGNDGTGRNTFLNKFYDTGSIVFIPQNKFDEEIKRGSFKLTDTTTGATIVDDSNGNLYSTNATFSQSVSALSSSDNYVGNIFYNYGLAVLTETGSWSGSVNYDDLARDYNLRFESTNTMYVREFTIKAKKGAFGLTNNPTSRIGTGSFSGSILRPQLTGSEFSPYMTQLELYGDSGWPLLPIFRAKYPQPIKMRDDVDIIFKIRIDF